MSADLGGMTVSVAQRVHAPVEAVGALLRDLPTMAAFSPEVLSRLASTDRRVWTAVAVSLAVWFVPDTTYSLLSGFWRNALLNVGALVLLAPAVLAARPRAVDR